jgi:hypothetical protein
MRHCLSAPLVALILASLTTPIGAQSLGDLARREAERRKTVKPVKKDDGKVLTNKDVPVVVQPEAPPASSPAPESSSAPSEADKAGAASAEKPTGAAQTDATDAGETPKDQKYWSERQRQLREQLDRNEVYLQALQTRVNVLTTDFVNRDDPAQRSVIAGDRQKALDEITRLIAAISADKKAVADFEDEAHRAGVPPGWLR